MTYVEIRFFWLSLSTTKCSGISFTHICEWKRRSSAYDSSRSSSWICVVETMVVGFASMIYFSLSAAVSLGSELKSGSDSEDLISTTNDYFERHSLVLCQGILWNSHHLPVSFFVFWSPFFACDGDWFPFSFGCVLWARVSLALLLRWVCRSKVSLVLLLKFLLDFDNIPIGESKWRDVKEFHLNLDVLM